MGILYIVSTPIGNLEDITARALRVLKEAALIAAEDTRHTRKLLNHYNIHTPMVSFHEHNERARGFSLIEQLLGGKDIALVSDAGTPAISDPGFRLVKAAVTANVPVVSVPGPSAVISALSVAGLPTDQFTFIGFLPDKEGKRRTKLAEFKNYDHTLVFYVSKWKIERTLKDMLEIFGDRPAVLCREITKMHEEVRRSTISRLLGDVQKAGIKGEMTLIVGGLC